MRHNFARLTLTAATLAWVTVGCGPPRQPTPAATERAPDAPGPASPREGQGPAFPGGVSEREEPLPTDPREADVRAVMAQFLAAAKTGDVKAVAEVCDPSLLRTLKNKNPTPREFEAEITDVLVLTDTAEVTVHQRYAQPIGEHHDFALTCKLILVNKKWKVLQTKARAVPARQR